jgi:hypothetical protein
MVFNTTYDLWLLKFPIYLPIIYCILLFGFPEYEYFIAFFTLALLAEPHFGATIPFFLNKVNKKKIISERIYLVYFPIAIVIMAFLSYIYINPLFFLIFFLINVYHVTRQSVGVSKLFIKKKDEIYFHEYSIYFANIILFIYAIMKFYLGSINESNIFFINTSLILLLTFYIFIYIKKFGYSENVLQVMTGILIFSPICFVDKPIHAIVMGVTMHYIQYISLTYKIVKGRAEDQEKKKIQINYSFIIIIITYGIIMAVLSMSNKLDNEIFKHLLLIPLLGQLLHFYIDGFLWKFSDPHHRANTLKYIK